jgi:hypothetical protein
VSKYIVNKKDFIPLSKTHKFSHNFIDRSKQKFGRLCLIKIVGHIAYNGVKKKPVYLAKCDCGKKIYVRGNDVITRKTASCGCWKSEVTSEFNKRTKSRVLHCTKGSVWQGYKAGAKKRNIKFNLTKDEFFELCDQNCYYCGQKPSQVRKARNGKLSNFIYNGIDRKNNDKGYEIDNVVPCCGLCNKMKLTQNYKEFIRRIKKISKRFN